MSDRSAASEPATASTHTDNGLVAAIPLASDQTASVQPVPVAQPCAGTAVSASTSASEASPLMHWRASSLSAMCAEDAAPDVAAANTLRSDMQRLTLQSGDAAADMQTPTLQSPTGGGARAGLQAYLRVEDIVVALFLT